MPWGQKTKRQKQYCNKFTKDFFKNGLSKKKKLKGQFYVIYHLLQFAKKLQRPTEIGNTGTLWRRAQHCFMGIWQGKHEGKC